MSTITLTHPDTSQRISIPAEPKATIYLDFQTDQVTLERSGDNIVFNFADGGRIIIEGFYAQYDKTSLPEFVVDGKILPGSEFFDTFWPDLAPAAGPAAQAAERGARYNEHSDSALASGLGHLDSVENPAQGVSAAEMASLDFPPGVARGAGFGVAAGAGSDNPGPQAPTFPSGPFVRAVLYGSGHGGEYVSTNVFFAENNGTPAAVTSSDLDFTGVAPWARFSVTATLPEGWQNAWVDVAFDYSTGRLEFRLTPEGIAEMQRQEMAGKPLVDVIQITVLDRGTGDTFDYSVELIATKNQEFDSAAYDSQYGGNATPDIIGAFHQGQNGGGAYAIVSSARNDEIILNDTLIGGSSIHASGSADPSQMADDSNTIKLNAGVVNTTAGSTTLITSSAGELAVQGGVSAQGSGAENSINMGKGQIQIHNASGHGLDAASGANTILGREVAVDAGDRGISATDGGVNTVETRGGDVSINADGWAIVAENNSANDVSATGGSVSIVSSGGEGVYANENSTNSIRTTGGDINIQSIWEGVNAANGSTNSISATDGSITIAVDTWGVSSNVNCTNTITVTDGNLGIDALGRGIHAYENSTNTIAVTNGDVNVNAGWEGIISHFGGTNNIAVDNGSVSLNTKASGLLAFYDSKNDLVINNGSLHITSEGAGVNAGFGENSLVIHGGDASITSTSAYSAGVFASESGKNTINTDGTLTVSSAATGVSAENGGTNSLTGADIAIKATSKYGVFVAGADSENVISAGAGGKIVVDGGNYGLYAATGGKNAVDGGDIAITSTGNTNSQAAVFATGDNSVNTITAGAEGKVVVSGGWGGLGAASKGTNTVSGGDITITSGTSSPAVFANGSGSTNTVAAGAEGKIVINAYNEGLTAYSGGSNAISGGDVTINASHSAALWAAGDGSTNDINAGSDGKISVNGHVSAQIGGVNTLIGGDIRVGGAGNNPGMSAYGVQSANIVDGGAEGKVVISGTLGLAASQNGSNSIHVADVTVTGNATAVNGYGMSAGMSAASSGSNSITSAADAPLTVTITATAASAQNAIAMWAQGGGAVNWITGHSQTGGAGDSITLTGGIAMQTSSGGQNIITTGAGNDHITINGAVKGSGNQINVRGGSNTVTLNGAVETGSLNVIAAGGTYTLILQASDVQGFADRYGAWLNHMGSDPLMAGGLTSISFDGLDAANLPADFLTTFNDILYALNDGGVTIVPDALCDHLHDPAVAAAPMMFMAADAVEHGGTDSMHAATGDTGHDAHIAGQEAVQGHDAPDQADSHAPEETGNAAMGSGMAGQNPEAQADAHTAEADGTASLLHATGHEALSVLDDLLDNTSFYGSEDVGLLYHEDGQHQGSVGSVADGAGHYPGEIHADILLAQGDESLDSLLTGTSIDAGANGGIHEYGASASGNSAIGDVVASLTDMPAAMTGDARAENIPGAHLEGGIVAYGSDDSASAPVWASAQASAESYVQQAVNTAMRQMEDS